MKIQLVVMLVTDPFPTSSAVSRCVKRAGGNLWSSIYSWTGGEIFRRHLRGQEVICGALYIQGREGRFSGGI